MYLTRLSEFQQPVKTKLNSKHFFKIKVMKSGAGIVFLLLGWVVACLNGQVVFAESSSIDWEERNHTQQAVEDDHSVPMSQLLEHLELQIPGEIVGMGFAYVGGGWVYEFKIIDDKGRLLEAYVDAETGLVLSLEER